MLHKVLAVFSTLALVGFLVSTTLALATFSVLTPKIVGTYPSAADLPGEIVSISTATNEFAAQQVAAARPIFGEENVVLLVTNDGTRQRLYPDLVNGDILEKLVAQIEGWGGGTALLVGGTGDNQALDAFLSADAGAWSHQDELGRWRTTQAATLGALALLLLVAGGIMAFLALGPGDKRRETAEALRLPA